MLLLRILTSSNCLSCRTSAPPTSRAGAPRRQADVLLDPDWRSGDFSCVLTAIDKVGWMMTVPSHHADPNCRCPLRRNAAPSDTTHSLLSEKENGNSSNVPSSAACDGASLAPGRQRHHLPKQLGRERPPARHSRVLFPAGARNFE